MKKILSFMDNITHSISEKFEEITDKLRTKIEDTKFYQKHIAKINWNYPKFIIFVSNILIIYTILVACYNVILPIYNHYVYWGNILHLTMLIAYIIFGIVTVKKNSISLVITALIIGYAII